MLTKCGLFRFRRLSTLVPISLHPTTGVLDSGLDPGPPPPHFYQFLLGHIKCPLNINTVFFPHPPKFYLSLSLNSYISFACYNLISRNLLGATLSCPVQRDSHPPLWAPPCPPPAACHCPVPQVVPFLHLLQPVFLVSLIHTPALYSQTCGKLQENGVQEPCSEQVADEAGG